MNAIATRIIFKGTALFLWVYFIYYIAGFGIGLTAKYGIGNSPYTFFWLPFLTVVVISGVFQAGLYLADEASNSKLNIRILCFLALMPTFLFINISLFWGLYDIIFLGNKVLNLSFTIPQIIILGIYGWGIVHLFRGKSRKL